MSKEAIFSLFNTVSKTLTPTRIMLIFAVCLLGSLVIYVTYRHTTDGTVYNPSLNRINILISLVTCVIMLMISSNIVISLGMVGALSIVRFRTAIKDARDTLFVFWAIVHGLCVGSQNFILAGLSVLFISAVCFALKLLPEGKGKYTLIIRADESLQTNAVEELLFQYAASHKMDAANHTETAVELVYSIRGKQCMQICTALKQLPGVHQVNLINAND